MVVSKLNKVFIFLGIVVVFSSLLFLFSQFKLNNLNDLKNNLIIKLNRSIISYKQINKTINKIDRSLDSIQIQRYRLLYPSLKPFFELEKTYSILTVNSDYISGTLVPKSIYSNTRVPRLLFAKNDTLGSELENMRNNSNEYYPFSNIDYYPFYFTIKNNELQFNAYLRDVSNNLILFISNNRWCINKKYARDIKITPSTISLKTQFDEPFIDIEFIDNYSIVFSGLLKGENNYLMISYQYNKKYAILAHLKKVNEK